MELALFVWFAGVVDDLSLLIGFIGFITAMSLIFCSACAYLISDKDFNKPEIFKTKKWKFNLGVVFGLFLCLISNLIPNERTMYLMVGAYMAQEIVTSDKFKNTSNDVYDIVNLKIKSIKKDLEYEVVGEDKNSDTTVDN